MLTGFFHVVPFRLLTWISRLLPQLTTLTAKSSSTRNLLLHPSLQLLIPDEIEEPNSELTLLSCQLAQGLSIIQGTALIHSGSKRFLGRRYPIEVSMAGSYAQRLFRFASAGSR